MSFTSDIAKFAKHMKITVDEAAIATLLNTSSDIVVGTPFNEGRARGNWQPSIGSAKNGTLDLKINSPDLNKIEAVVRKSIGSDYYMVNNLPYIKKLEFEGHSLQAPAGMVRIAIENMQKNLDDAVSRLT